MGGHHSRASHSQLRSASYSTHHHYHPKVHNSINGDRPFPPLLFHPRTKGSRILIDPSQKTVKRTASFCDGIVFSNRHVAINEVVRLEITASQSSWQGALRIGFTTEDPSTMSPDRLPKYSCPDLAAKPGFWVKALPDELLHTGNVISFWVNIKGSVFYQVYNDNPKRLLSHLPVWQLLWVLIDVYGQTKGVQFLDNDLHAGVAFTARHRNGFQQRKRGDPLPLSLFGEECPQQRGVHVLLPPHYQEHGPLNGCCRHDPDAEPHRGEHVPPPDRHGEMWANHPLKISDADVRDPSPPSSPPPPAVFDSVSSSPLPSHAEAAAAWEECVVCYEEAVDTVLYSCGHMCLCHRCALRLKEGQCPICRKKITDVIKIYRSSVRR
ncbi:E3 ubiquitin-protein ligase NEURL1-like [Nerophis ophidion]|uniref:E3 ubiquitin-protein ligase NEURL1-like n=1 Tax=Nerophis ophidion TaxID=159077 RepID=UPI002ADF448B|nr:E3 ubiquitin-protein ligase NEURL1-like [Nerophis ophidion]XP_061767572.1 E3 ubiquitin-protein ligase NEURL1-like [Nerophis ophidion]